jgi:hypothetical protein
MTHTHETIEDRIAVLDDAGLVKLCHDLANRVSYYNAAEGSAYFKETDERALAKKNLAKVSNAAESRGIEISFAGKGYLL